MTSMKNLLSFAAPAALVFAVQVCSIDAVMAMDPNKDAPSTPPRKAATAAAPQTPASDDVARLMQAMASPAPQKSAAAHESDNESEDDENDDPELDALKSKSAALERQLIAKRGQLQQANTVIGQLTEGLASVHSAAKSLKIDKKKLEEELANAKADEERVEKKAAEDKQLLQKQLEKLKADKEAMLQAAHVATHKKAETVAAKALEEETRKAVLEKEKRAEKERKKKEKEEKARKMREETERREADEVAAAKLQSEMLAKVSAQLAQMEPFSPQKPKETAAAPKK